jgi:hypothetical protein
MGDRFRPQEPATIVSVADCNDRRKLPAARRAKLRLATSPMNGCNEDKVKQVIGIADRDHLHLAVLVCFGFAAEVRQHPG